MFFFSPSELSLGLLLVGTLEEGGLAGVDTSIVRFLISLELLLCLFTLALLSLEDVEVAEILTLGILLFLF